MRPYLEHVPVSDDASWSLLNRRLDDAIPFQWHHHPEFELTLTLNSVGQRFVGDSVGNYAHGDLVLVGPNLPHSWASQAKIAQDGPHVALVFWFRREWIEAAIAGSVELQPVKALIDRAAGGLAFRPETGLGLRQDFEAIFGLPPVEKLLGLFSILARLAEATDAKPLSRTVPPQDSGNRSRLDRTLIFLHQHYVEDIGLEALAEVAALSVSGLHRMFVRHTGGSVIDYVTGLRIGDASARLSSGTAPIGFIAEAVGYRSLANFNRQFKALRGMTPRQYRAKFRNAARPDPSRLPRPSGNGVG
ncbi:AraC family transcriptional regulator [Devosia sp. 63-57]|uniref:AraC family transcriptional regulator n=1 Tax=Devosia sp. 63-57 TaxID=1895751 RepID=UPI00086C56C6|nr:AraC family transcriptional regulator [Devosia sp. 63-57]ODT48039.1 MAG: transcriptional regulator [Pelagibacterium sp. SCN 63-126]ODU85564.1 MAG: transcriptional regulator [Pelagibacterium sp. SCN 63-17]OJX42253.1 MAG: AraC family transcriptional regulator [Devosia sp. 63-57]